VCVFFYLIKAVHCIKVLSSFVCRQCIRDRGDSAGAAPAERGQLFDPVAGRSRPAGGVSGDAAGRRLRSVPAVDAGARAVRHVDVERRAVLHGLHPPPGRHCR